MVYRDYGGLVAATFPVNAWKKMDQPNIETNIREVDQSRLSALATSMCSAYANLRYVDYKQAEYDCERLAAGLKQFYPGKDLDGFRFAAIPRGGLIVLGMLAYLLGLKPDRIQPGSGATGPLIVVDDCALSGARFSRFIETTNSQRLVFAHLYSHPGLRQGILDKEARVERCIAAHDLADHSTEGLSEAEHEAWLKRWKPRMGAKRYWIGQPSPVSFAWSEPDFYLWNTATNTAEQGWRFIAPHLCLKNKADLGLPPPDGAYEPCWRVPRALAFACFDETLWLVRLDTKQVHSLSDVAADMWRALAVYGHRRPATDFLHALYDVGEDQLRDELASFAEVMLNKGLLEQTHQSSAQS